LRTTGIQIGGVAFSPDGQRLAAGVGRMMTGESAHVIVWDAATGQELLELPGVGKVLSHVAFGPDSTRLAAFSASASTGLIWTAARPQRPDTDRWPVIFADDFKRTELGPRWKPLTPWTAADGHLCGRLTDSSYFKIPVRTASVVPLVKLPQTVEVRFDCWSSADMNLFAMFIKDGAHNGVQAWLLGAPQLYGVRGAGIAWQGGATYCPLITTNPHVEVRPKTRYRVRVLREPRRVTTFVDGVEVASATVPLLETPTLALGGMWGPLGAEVFLANVEIRAPAGGGGK
jgi:hypothetical protein